MEHRWLSRTGFSPRCRGDNVVDWDRRDVCRHEPAGVRDDLLPYINWIDRLRPHGALVFFVVANTLFVLFGAWCYLARIKPKAPNAGSFVMFWAIIETLNGILHPTWTLTAGTYIPGTGTAPLLLVTALALLWRWTKEQSSQAAV